MLSEECLKVNLGSSHDLIRTPNCSKLENPYGYQNYINCRIKEIQSRFPDLCLSSPGDDGEHHSNTQGNANDGSSGFTNTYNHNEQEGIVK